MRCGKGCGGNHILILALCGVCRHHICWEIPVFRISGNTANCPYRPWDCDPSPSVRSPAIACQRCPRKVRDPFAPDRVPAFGNMGRGRRALGNSGLPRTLEASGATVYFCRCGAGSGILGALLDYFRVSKIPQITTRIVRFFLGDIKHLLPGIQHLHLRPTGQSLDGLSVTSVN